MNTTAKAAEADPAPAFDQLVARNDELAEVNAVLAEENIRLRKGIEKARIYAGDNLPAAVGLSIVAMLEKALTGGA